MKTALGTGMAGIMVGPTYLLDSTPIVSQMKGAPLPCTVTLKITAGDTLTFEQSFDDGLTYVLEATITATQSFVLTSGCTQIRMTRSSGTSITSYFTVC